MEKKLELEEILKKCVEEVREEIEKKKNETQSIYKSNSKILNLYQKSLK